MKNKDIKIQRDPIASLIDGFSDFTKYFEGYKDIEYPYYKSSKSVGHVNLSNDDKEYTIEVAAPGFSKKDLGIELKDNIITIKGEYSNESNETDNDKKYTRREFSKSSFNRSFTFPEDATGEIDARFDDGILYIQLKKKEVQPKEELKKIEIK